MKLMLCLSGLHRALSKEIVKQESELKTLNIDKHKGNLPRKLVSFINAVFVFALFCFSKERHIFVPHIYGPWIATFIFFANRLSLYDDGLAYYNDTAIPNKKIVYLYTLLANKFILRKNGIKHRLTTYSDLISNLDYKTYYHILEHSRRHNNFKRLLLSGERADRAISAVPHVVFLDSDSGTFIDEDVRAVFRYLRRNYLSTFGAIEFCFKAHPRHDPTIVPLLKNKNFGEEIIEDFEEYLRSKQVDRLYTFYSSAAISTIIISPTTEVRVFTNMRLRQTFDKLHNLLDTLGVVFIEI